MGAHQPIAGSVRVFVSGGRAVFEAAFVRRAVRMVLYELNVLLKGTTKTWNTVDLIRRCARTVVRNGGVVRNIANHGIRPLGYKIRKNQETFDEAHYVTIQADMAPKVLTEVRHSLRVSDTVLRWMVMNTQQNISELARNVAKTRTQRTPLVSNTPVVMRAAADLKIEQNSEFGVGIFSMGRQPGLGSKTFDSAGRIKSETATQSKSPTPSTPTSTPR